MRDDPCPIDRIRAIPGDTLFTDRVIGWCVGTARSRRDAGIDFADLVSYAMESVLAASRKVAGDVDRLLGMSMLEFRHRVGHDHRARMTIKRSGLTRIEGDEVDFHYRNTESPDLGPLERAMIADEYRYHASRNFTCPECHRIVTTRGEIRGGLCRWCHDKDVYASRGKAGRPMEAVA